MSDLWRYEPKACDGHFCPKDCDACTVGESLWDDTAEGFEADLDMGFDPYLGCYTDDV